MKSTWRPLLLWNAPVLFAAMLQAQTPAAGGAATGKESTDPRQAMLETRTSPGYIKGVEGTAAEFEHKVQPECAGIQMHWGQAVAVPYGALETWPTGGLRKGTWVETVPGTACGQTRRYRVIVTMRDGKGALQALLPGDGYAANLLETDTSKYVAVLTGVYFKNQNCTPYVLNTERVEKDHDQHPKQVWHEVWTVTACGKLLDMTFGFIPDAVGDGTTIEASNKDVRLAPDQKRSSY